MTKDEETTSEPWQNFNMSKLIAQFLKILDEINKSGKILI